MIMEEGEFAVIVHTWRDTEPETYVARVLIPYDDVEWRRLKIGPFEDPDECTPCVSWCHENIGFGFDGWMTRLEHYNGRNGVKEFYFKELRHALLFMLTWR